MWNALVQDLGEIIGLANGQRRHCPGAGADDDQHQVVNIHGSTTDHFVIVYCHGCATQGKDPALTAVGQATLVV